MRKKRRMNNLLAHMKIGASFLILIQMGMGCSPSHYTKDDFKEKYKENDFAGEYRATESNKKLVFSDSSFIWYSQLQRHIRLYACCDTLSLGSWGLVKGNEFIYLTTPEYYRRSFLDFTVKEGKDTSTDTIKFFINHAVKRLVRDGDPVKELTFYISIDVRGGEALALKQIYTGDDDPYVFKFLNPNKRIIERFDVNAYPGPDFGGRDIGTKAVRTPFYYVGNEASNRFEIDIPELTYEYMTYRRLNRDFVRIINKRSLEWDGVIYKKQ